MLPEDNQVQESQEEGAASRGGSPEPLLLPKQRCCCSASASKQLSPAVSNPGLFVIFKEGPGGIPGIFFSKINRTLDLFHQKKKKKKKEQALFLVGTGLEPGEEGAAAEGEGRPEATFLPPQGVSSTKEQ